jgi:hypothetical protein
VEAAVLPALVPALLVPVEAPVDALVTSLADPLEPEPGFLAFVQPAQTAIAAVTRAVENQILVKAALVIATAQGHPKE